MELWVCMDGPTTLHLVHAVRVCATVEVVLELEASLAPSFLRLVRPVMPFRLSRRGLAWV
jgi:hypothetical protein